MSNGRADSPLRSILAAHLAGAFCGVLSGSAIMCAINNAPGLGLTIAICALSPGFFFGFLMGGILCEAGNRGNWASMVSVGMLASGGGTVVIVLGSFMGLFDSVGAVPLLFAELVSGIITVLGVRTVLGLRTKIKVWGPWLILASLLTGVTVIILFYFAWDDPHQNPWFFILLSFVIGQSLTAGPLGWLRWKLKRDLADPPAGGEAKSI